MATYLLDTCVLIDAINDKKNRRPVLRDLLIAGNTLACCPINVMEVYAGMRPSEEENTLRFLSSLDYFPLSFQTAAPAGELKRDYGRKGRTLTLTGTAIAAVAIQNQLTLITDNVKDFPMKNLTLFPIPTN